MATITIRIIKSFQYKNVVNVVFHSIDLEFSVESFTRQICERIKDNPRLKSVSFDSFKVYSRPFQAKTNNLVINCDDADDAKDLISIFPANSCRSLAEVEMEDQCEVSLFSLQQYQEYRANPQMHW